MEPNKIMDVKDHTADFDPADIEANKGISVLSYLWILFLIPLLAKKDSAYAQYHAKQGANLFIIEIIVNIVVFIIAFIFGLIKLSIIGSIISWIVYVVFLVLVIMGIVNAATGKAKELPIIGNIKIVK